VAGLNEALWAKAAGAKLLRTARVRADTTVIAANVAYPADAGPLAKAAGKLVRAARRVPAAGGAAGTVMTDRRRAAGRRAREMAATIYLGLTRVEKLDQGQELGFLHRPQTSRRYVAVGIEDT
jgi:transposase, IS5 family